MDIINNLKQTFRHGNSVTKLIFINLSVFFILKIIDIILLLFNIQGDFIWTYLAVPADLTLVLHRFWTPVTYMFLHKDVMHIFFNMLSLYWFGKIFLFYFNEKQLIGLYLLGGLVAGALYLVAFNVFPYYAPLVSQSVLLGASGSIMAIIVATATQSPNMELQLLLLGRVKLKYIAVAAVLMSFFGITSVNGGGQMAHLGGALTGYLFVVSLRQGRDISSVFNKILNPIATLFSRPKLKVKHNKTRYKAPMSDAEFNMNKARRMEGIDKILDKIKTSGYESLSASEKKQLFDQSNKS